MLTADEARAMTATNTITLADVEEKIRDAAARGKRSTSISPDSAVADEIIAALRDAGYTVAHSPSLYCNIYWDEQTKERE